jgi:hypothetical protein
MIKVLYHGSNRPTLLNNSRQQKIYSSKTRTTVRKRNIAARSHNHWCRGRAPLQIYSMEQSPSWKATRYSGSHEIPRILWKPKVHYRFHNSPPPTCPYPYTHQSSPCPPPQSKFLKIHLNIILPSTSGSSKWSLPVTFPHQTPVRPSLPYVLHDPPILFLLILSPEEYLVRSTDH